MVGSYSSTKCDWMNWIVRADLPTPPPPTTTSLYSRRKEADMAGATTTSLLRLSFSCSRETIDGPKSNTQTQAQRATQTGRRPSPAVKLVGWMDGRRPEHKRASLVKLLGTCRHQHARSTCFPLFSLTQPCFCLTFGACLAHSLCF